MRLTIKLEEAEKLVKRMTEHEDIEIFGALIQITRVEWQYNQFHPGYADVEISVVQVQVISGNTKA